MFPTEPPGFRCLSPPEVVVFADIPGQKSRAFRTESSGEVGMIQTAKRSALFIAIAAGQSVGDAATDHRVADLRFTRGC
jgi:hypothetical protein